MSIEHHPPETMVAAFAAGTLDHGQHIALATHLAGCAHCRAFEQSLEQVGGAVLAEMAPSPMAEDALAAIETRLEEPEPAAAVPLAPAPEIGLRGLPPFLRRYRFGAWRWVAPAVRLRPVTLPVPSKTRVFLLSSGAGTNMLPHTHTGFEMTCVLSGAFVQGGMRYGPGDFDHGDETIDHQPLVQPGEDCLCLVAMQGDLQLKGFLGRLMQPFIRL